MNGAVFDSTFNIFFKLKIAKTYDAMLSTPLAPTDIALGELSWALLRGSIYSSAFLIAMTGFGYVLTPWAALCFPAALLMSFAFAGVGMAATSYMRSWTDFDKVSLAIIPALSLLGHLLPALGLPGLAPGRRPLHPALPRGGHGPLPRRRPLLLVHPGSRRLSGRHGRDRPHRHRPAPGQAAPALRALRPCQKLGPPLGVW